MNWRRCSALRATKPGWRCNLSSSVGVSNSNATTHRVVVAKRKNRSGLTEEPLQSGSGLSASSQATGPIDEQPDSPDELELIKAVLAGDVDSFEPLIQRHQSRVFATARRYARTEVEVQDIVQEIFVKAFQKLHTFRHEAPFEHWLMRMTVRTCYDFLRGHQRNREITFSDYSSVDVDWLERFTGEPGEDPSNAAMAREVVHRVLDQMTPAARLVLTLLEIEDRSVKEVAQLTGWSVALVKVRAFRARAEMRKCFERMTRQKQL
jgi:RNA polymerase sigma-70 factor, ECF subfamily